MRIAVAVVNLVLGAVYTGYGVMTLIDMKRGWRTMGFSHFGAAWVLMAFTCGPHHLDHGFHALFSRGAAGGLDLWAVAIGMPAGIAWFLLRLEAFGGGRGDRFLSGTPGWVKALPTLAGAYAAALVAGSIYALRDGARYSSLLPPSATLLILYATIGYFLLRTQLRTRESEGGFSVSGLTLGIVFPTCGLMHAMHAVYASAGVYAVDRTQLTIDWLSIPAAIYFLWVVRGLYIDSLQDWNTWDRTPVMAG
jgi:hypothetical protein